MIKGIQCRQQPVQRQALARVDLQEAVAALAARIDRLHLVDTDPRRVPFTPDEALERLLVSSEQP